MKNALTHEQGERYASDGCVFPIDVLSRAEAAEGRRRLEDAEARCGNLHYSPKPHLTFRFVDELIRDPRIVDRIESLIGPNILVWDSTFIIKEARDARFVSWHQDLTYWGLEPPDVVSVWLALSPSTPESGCMRFLPGSHTAQLPHRDTFAEQNILSRGQEVALHVEERKVVDVVLAPGQMSLHHGRVVHGSAPNRLGRPADRAQRPVPADPRAAGRRWTRQRRPGARRRQLPSLRGGAPADRRLHGGRAPRRFATSSRRGGPRTSIAARTAS